MQESPHDVHKYRQMDRHMYVLTNVFLDKKMDVQTNRWMDGSSKLPTVTLTGEISTGIERGGPQ